MLKNKSTKILSEINNFITSSEKAVFKTLELFKALNLLNIKLEIKDYNQATYKKNRYFIDIIAFSIIFSKKHKQFIKIKISQLP